MSETPPGYRGFRRETDPTRMANQPALQTSSGAIWLVVGAIFLAVSMIPLVPLIFASPGLSRPAAIGTAVAVIACYAAIVVFRFAFPRGRRRLRWMAAAFIAMAAIGVLGMLLCLGIETAAVRLA